MRLMKIFVFSLVMALSTSSGWCAWDRTKPTDSEKLKDTPALIRANWQAIETGTDSALQITDAKVASSAAIADTKLATISTAGKVNASALTSLSSTPSGAGALPLVNGGTGQATRQAALDALTYSTYGTSGQALVTNATNSSWGYPSSLTVASATTGDLLYYNGTSWVRLAPGTTAYTLTSNGAGVAPSYTQTSLTAGVTGILAISNGGTGQTTAQEAIDALTVASGGTSGQAWVTNGTNGGWATVGMSAYTAGSFLDGSIASTVRSKTGQSWQKAKQLTPSMRGGTATISFDLFVNSGYNGSGRIYVNDIAVGTTRTQNNTMGGGTYITYTENIAFSSGDVISIYVYGPQDGSTVSAKNLKVLCAKPSMPAEDTGY